jgi:hypothetical protein
MFEIVDGIHKAFRIESTWAFVLLIAAGFGIVGGGLAWIVDKGYRNSPEYKAAQEVAAKPVGSVRETPITKESKLVEDPPAPTPIHRHANGSERVEQAQKPQPSESLTRPLIQSAPAGINIGGDNRGSATVNNFGPIQYPLLGEQPTYTFCVSPSDPLPQSLAKAHQGAAYQTKMTITTDIRITRPGFLLVFDGAVLPNVSPSVVGISQSSFFKTDSLNKVGFYFSTLASETSWFPNQKMMVTVFSAQPVKLVGVGATYGIVENANQRTTIIGKLVINCPD